MTDGAGEVSLRAEAELRGKLEESLTQQAAAADVLKIISRSHFDLQAVLEMLIKTAVKLCGANRGSIFLRDKDVFPLKAASDTTPEFLQYWRANPPSAGRGSATSRVIASGQVEVILDVFADPEMEMPASSLNRIRAALGVPMLRDEAVEGVLVLTRSQPGPFTQTQINLVQTFADQAMIAIQNARLFDEVQAKSADLHEALQHQTATSEVLQVISRSPGELDPVFQTILSNASSICEAQFGLLLLLENGGFRCTSMFNLPSAFAETFLRNPIIHPPPIDPLGRLIATSELVHVVDVMHEPAYLTGFPPIVELVELGGARTLLLVPMMRERDIVGVIALFRQSVHAFDGKQIELVTNFGSQAVIAIENARLLNELRERTADLSESLQVQTATADVLKVISRSAFDLQTVLDTLVISAVRLCNADRACIFQKKGDVYRWVSNFGFSAELIAYADEHPFTAGTHSTTSRVALEGKPIHNHDVLADPNYRASEYQRLGNYRTMLGIPLLREGVPIGVFILTRQEVRPFTDRQIELVTSFADQAVIAIENVRLFNEVQVRTSELAASLDDLRTAQDRLVQTEKLASLGQLTAGIAHEIKNPLNFINNFAALSADLTDELNDSLKPVAFDEAVRADVDEITGTLKDNLSKVVHHGKRADSIVKNMLLHSREGSGEHRPADVNALVDESLNLAYHGARAEKPQFNVTLQRDFDPQAGIIEVFPQEITRVLLNLISNGFYAVTKRRADSDGGTEFDPQVTAITRGEPDSVVIRIRDNGTGITPEVKEKMFNPFFTTKPAGEGTGLGLSMSHDIIVKQHGGTIKVETELGAFTEFIVTLRRKVLLQKTPGETE